MKKALLISFLSFLGGAALAALILANPFHWPWVHSLQAALSIQHQGAQGSGDAIQLWTCGMHPQVLQDKPGKCPICQMDLVPVPKSGADPAKERRIKHWRAPMDPTFVSDKPGKSPMGMDLIPVYEDEEGSAPGLVRIDPIIVQNIGVQSTEIRRIDIPYRIRTVGSFRYNDGQLFWVTTKFEGWIEKVHINYLGEPVHKGQPLFEIYSPQLVTTQNEYLQALAYTRRMGEAGYPDVRRRAESLLDSSRKRLAFWDISDQQVEELERTGVAKRTLTVVSPVSGVLSQKMTQALEGMFAKPGMNLYQVVDLATIWVEAEIFEDQVPWLKIGQRAKVEAAYQPGRTRIGTVRYIYPAVNDRTRTLKVSIELPNPGQQLRADMYANVTFDVPSARGVLAVPEESVIHSGSRNIVVLDLGEGAFQVQEVELGLNGNGLWEVRQGVSEGDRVVVSSQFLIDSESNLRAAIRALNPRQGSADTSGQPPDSASQHQH